MTMPTRAPAGSRSARGPGASRAAGVATAEREATSDRLSREALSAYERLYRALDFDEPDMSANISYAVCRTVLERRAAAKPYVVPAERAERIERLIANVSATTDRRTLAFWFPGFAEQVLGELERRQGRGPAISAAPVAVAAGPRRRSGEQSTG
jgi:hypothetical protein